MSYSGSFRVAWPIAVQCETNATGGTRVRASILGEDLPEMAIDGYDVDARGFDQIRDQVEGLVADAIARALRVPEDIE